MGAASRRVVGRTPPSAAGRPKRPGEEIVHEFSDAFASRTSQSMRAPGNSPTRWTPVVAGLGGQVTGPCMESGIVRPDSPGPRRARGRADPGPTCSRCSTRGYPEPRLSRTSLDDLVQRQAAAEKCGGHADHDLRMRPYVRRRRVVVVGVHAHELAGTGHRRGDVVGQRQGPVGHAAQLAQACTRTNRRRRWDPPTGCPRLDSPELRDGMLGHQPPQFRVAEAELRVLVAALRFPSTSAKNSGC